MSGIGQNIRKERNQHFWTQKYLAQAIGTTEQNVSRWERGQTVPDIYYRQKLSELFSLLLIIEGRSGKEGIFGHER